VLCIVIIIIIIIIIGKPAVWNHSLPLKILADSSTGFHSFDLFADQNRQLCVEPPTIRIRTLCVQLLSMKVKSVSELYGQKLYAPQWQGGPVVPPRNPYSLVSTTHEVTVEVL
jgi:hypothetical protein